MTTASSTALGESDAIVSMSGMAMAMAIRDGSLSAVDALKAHLERIERKNPLVRAVVALDETRALDDARRADQELRAVGPRGILHGVPMTVKDTYDTAGVVTTVGLPWLRKNVPHEDAALVRSLRRAGAVIFGKTNCPFASYDFQCVHPLYGRTNNPWNLGHTPGGSSGGSAAALAARMTPLELGSDVAGSIRVPAHFSGVFGLRPTEGILDGRGHGHQPGSPDVFKHFVTCGPLARNAADLRLMMQCLGAPSPRQLPFTTRARGADRPFKLRGARIAYIDDWSGVTVDEETARLLRSLLDALRAAGATVEKAAPDHFDGFEAYEVWGKAHGFEYRAALPMGGPGPMPWVARAMMHAVLGGPLARYVGQGITSSSKAYFAALEQREALVEKMDDFLARFDAWLTPVTCTPAFTHRRTGASIAVNGRRVPYSLANGFYTCATAAAGNPIVAAPIGATRGGLPVGIQVHGRRGADARVIDVAEAIAALCPAAPWPH